MRKITLIVLVNLIFGFQVFAQTVSTFTDGTPDDAIALDSQGNIYASNFTGDTVFKFTPLGEMTAFITGLNTPNGLAFDSNDNLFVCDFSASTIYKFDTNGNQLDSYAIAGNPSGIIKSFVNDDMIFTIYNGNSINNLATDGTITTLSSDSSLNGPVGLAIDDMGSLYVGNYNDREIYRMSGSGDLVYIAQLPTDGGPLPNLGFITYGQGMLWGTTMGSDKIYAVNPDGIDDFSLFAGSVSGGIDGDISIATFNTPNGILFNESEDTMYITDFGSKNLRVISDVVLEVDNFNLSENKVVVYPNPAVDRVTISTTLLEDAQFHMEVYNVLGESIYTKTGLSDNQIISEIIDISSWANGAYFINVSAGKFSETKKIVK